MGAETVGGDMSRVTGARLDAGEAAVLGSRGESERVVAERVWVAMSGVRCGVGRPSTVSGVSLAGARAALAGGATATSVRKRFRISWALAKRLRADLDRGV